MNAKDQDLGAHQETTTEPNVIATRTGRVSVDDTGIVRAEVSPKAKQSLEHSKENIVSVIEIAKGRKIPLLVDLRGIWFMSREARMYYSGEETAKVALAVALLVTSPISRIVGNYFHGTNKSLYPMKIFSSEVEAREWLKGFLQ